MTTKDKFTFGTVSVPDGKRGLWSVDTFELTQEDVLMDNLRAVRNGHGYMIARPGTYKRLVHAQRGVIMSNTHMERRTAIEAYLAATGRVLVNGLGLGMVLEGMLAKPDVQHVTVVEIDGDVIDLVGSHFKSDPRVTIVHADAHEYTPQQKERFDYVWHDIWDEISADNLPSMAKLNRRYARRAAKQGTWSRAQVYADLRANGMTVAEALA